MQKNNKGITLIALVVTIIVMIILASITVTALTGKKSTINQTTDTTESAQRESIIEKIEADLLQEKMKTGNMPTKDELKTIIQENGYNEGNLEEDSFITKDGGYTIYYEEIIGWQDFNTMDELKVGDFVNYIDKNGETIECRVLYDKEYNENNNVNYGIQIISNDKVDMVSIGASDETATINSYNNAITTLNQKAEEHLNYTYAQSARCVGSVPDNKNFENTEYFENDEMELIFNGKLKNTDTNSEIDYKQMEKYNMIKINSYENYWLASRFINFNNNQAEYYIRYIENSTEPSYEGGEFIMTDGNYMYITNEHTYALRIVFTLRNDLKIIGGDGVNTPYILSK